jgi:hypothetical protein
MFVNAHHNEQQQRPSAKYKSRCINQAKKAVPASRESYLPTDRNGQIDPCLRIIIFCSNPQKDREAKAIIAHLDDNVQVFTDLPPKVDGSLKSYLKVEIAKLNWLWKAGGATIDANPCLAIRILWWGEDGTGSLFRPKVNGLMNKSKAQYTQTTAKYKIKSGAKQLSAYFNGWFDTMIGY